MDTQNVTLALPKELLHRAKQVAVQRRMSLSALLAQMLTELVEQDDAYRAARDRQLAILERGWDLGLQGNITWTRDELHER